MGETNEQFTSILNKVSKTLEKDASVDIFEAGDIRITSFVPHGILTRQPMLDLCIKRDGIPIGKVVEFYGLPASGKTTAAYHIIAETQKVGGIALFVDTEHSFDLERAIECGCKKANLQVSSADSIDGVFRVILAFLAALEDVGFSKDVVIVVDSITAVGTEFDIENVPPGGQSRPGEEARAIKAGLKRIVPKLSRLKVSCVMINHVIKNPAARFGSDEQSGGGYAIKFYAAVRCKFVRIGEFYEGKKADNKRLGHKVLVMVEKLKGAQQKRFSFDTKVLNDIGFDSKGQLLAALVEIGLIKDLGRRKYVRLDAETGEEQDGFHEEDWPGILDQKGGFDKTYQWFIEQATERGHIRPWGT